MVMKLAVNAVEKKISVETYNALLSDYEFAYALSRGFRLMNTEAPETEDLEEARKQLLELLADHPELKEEHERLFHLIEDYVPDQIKAEEIGELLHWK